jgi:hypothetical protein
VKKVEGIIEGPEDVRGGVRGGGGVGGRRSGRRIVEGVEFGVGVLGVEVWKECALVWVGGKGRLRWESGEGSGV